MSCLCLETVEISDLDYRYHHGTSSLVATTLQSTVEVEGMCFGM
jgi:hypothetical protein